MRALFLLLLLANLAFLAWSRWIQPGPSAAGIAVAPSVAATTLRLASEVPAPTESPLDDGLAANAACISAGPYLERAQADETAARLLDLGFAARLRAATGEVRVGQWVRIEDLATPEDAANALAAMKAAGATEGYIVTDEPPGTVVSLGVYSDPAKVAEVVELARKAGFAAVATDRFRSAEAYWLDVDRLANGGLPQLEEFGPGAGSGLELQACPAADAAAAPPALVPPGEGADRSQPQADATSRRGHG